MKLISWNVNGLRACVQKGFLDFFRESDADFFCLQETKLQAGQIALDLPGYEQYWCYAQKKGYSGTAIFTKHTPLSIQNGIGVASLDTEGRVITLEYEEFFLVTCYTPNAQRGLARLEHRLQWELAFGDYLCELDKKKPVILCGDLNVAHKEIDLKNPGSNRGNAGFSDEERAAFRHLLSRGFTDTFRHLHPDVTGAYTWWSYMFNARQNNAGWRIDYFLVSNRLQERIVSTPIHADVLGSDHCPVELELDLPCNGSIWRNAPAGEPQLLPVEKPAPTLSAPKAIIAGALVLALLLGFAAGTLLQPKLFPREDEALYNFYKEKVLPGFSSSAVQDNYWNLYYIDKDGMLVSTVTGNKLPLAINGSHVTPGVEPSQPDIGIIEPSGSVQDVSIHVSEKRLSMIQTGFVSSWVSSFMRNCLMLSDGGTQWYAELPVDENWLINWPNFWVRVDLPEALLADSLSCNASFIGGGYTDVTVVRQLDSAGNFIGFFIFGNSAYTRNMQIQLVDYTEEVGELSYIVPVTPVITDPASLSTEELALFAMHLPEVAIATVEHSNPDVSSAWELQFYSLMIQKYPAFLQLMTRGDAAKFLASYGTKDHPLSAQANLLYRMATMFTFYFPVASEPADIDPVPPIDVDGGFSDA